MFHHRSGGTVHLVALLAAHRALRDAPRPLRQEDVEALLGRLEAPREPRARPERPRAALTRSWRP